MKMIKAGDPFLYRYPRGDFHLFIIVLDSYKTESGFVCPCVMVTSWTGNPKLDDPSCILEAGEHEFITHKSYIAYKETIPFKADWIEYNLECGIYRAKPPVSKDLLERIIKSAKNSRKISKNNLKYYNQQ